MAFRLFPFATKFVIATLCLHPVVVQSGRKIDLSGRQSLTPKSNTPQNAPARFADLKEKMLWCENKLKPVWENKTSDDAHLWRELEKILDKQDEIDAREVDASDTCNMPGLYCPPHLRCALCIVYHQMRNHYIERKTGQVSELLEIIRSQTKPISESPNKEPHPLKMTCQEAKTMTWVVTKWKIDAAIELGMGMSDVDQMTSLTRVLHCDSGGTGSERTCTVLEELAETCPEEFANAALEHEEIFTCYALGLISAREGDVGGSDDQGHFEEPKGVERPDSQEPQADDLIIDDTIAAAGTEEDSEVAYGHAVLTTEDIEGLAWFESVEPTPASFEEDFQEQLGMILFRVQNDNADVAAVECAKQALIANASDRIVLFQTIPRCMDVLLDVLRLEAIQVQREGKCCCPIGGEACMWKKPNELERSWNPLVFFKRQCPSNLVEDQQATGCQQVSREPAFVPGSFAELSNKTEPEKQLGRALMASPPYGAYDDGMWATQTEVEMPTWATTDGPAWATTNAADLGKKLDDLAEDIYFSRERHVDASPLARDAVAWYEACEAGERVHRVHKGEKGDQISDKCPAPLATGEIKACPSSMEMYCYDKKSTRDPRGRCCCGTTGGIQEKGHFSVKKKAKAQCAADLAREVLLREEQERKEAALREAQEREEAAANENLDPWSANPFAEMPSNEPVRNRSDRFAYYEACRDDEILPLTEGCQDAKTSGTCPGRMEHGMVNVVDFTMFCYAYKKQDRCCCRARDVRVEKGSMLFGKDKRRGGPQCARDWPSYKPAKAVTIEPKQKKKGVFQALFRDDKPPPKAAVRVQFNTIFDDPALRSWVEKQSGEKKKWGPEPKKAAVAFMKKIEAKLQSLNEDRKAGTWWSCDEAVPRTCKLKSGAKGYLKWYTARISHLSEKIDRLIVHEDKIGRGRPQNFTELSACIAVVINQYRDAMKPELQALDTDARAVAGDFANLEIKSEGGAWHATKRGFGFLFRGISAIVGGLLYAAMTPLIMFNEGLLSVRHSGELWRFPIGFLFRGPVVSIFGKLHFQWWSLDYQEAEDDGFFRWGITGAVGRSWRLFRKATTEELCTDFTAQMFLMVDLHRQLNLANQCGETVNFAK